MVVHTQSELNHLLYLEDIQAGKRVSTDTNVPDFEVFLTGDWPKKDTNPAHPICYQMNQIINFSYSIGTPLYRMKEEELEMLLKDCNTKDRLLVRLAWRFNKAWLEFLDQRGEITFDEIFLNFADPSNKQFCFSKVTHLMIDEFQDISPNQIAFITQLKRNISARGNESSITCVGDDLQSIYGWRGSSAGFILNFSETFSIPSEAIEVVCLESNYRSSERILAIGNRITKMIINKHPKGYSVFRKNNPDSQSAFYPEKNRTINYDLAAKVLKKYLEKPSTTEQNPIFILASKTSLLSCQGSFWNDLINKNGKKIKRLTMHASKGLEADCVIALGDLSNPVGHPVRESLYRKARMPGDYYSMQLDEKHRVAYVAVTRAKQDLHWFTEGKKDSHVSYLLGEAGKSKPEIESM